MSNDIADTPWVSADKILSKMGEGELVAHCRSGLQYLQHLTLFRLRCTWFHVMPCAVSGTFGRVLECWDRKHKSYVAIKIVRNVQKYRDAAMIEVCSPSGPVSLLKASWLHMAQEWADNAQQPAVSNTSDTQLWPASTAQQEDRCQAVSEAAQQEQQEEFLQSS